MIKAIALIMGSMAVVSLILSGFIAPGTPDATPTPTPTPTPKETPTPTPKETPTPTPTPANNTTGNNTTGNNTAPAGQPDYYGSSSGSSGGSTPYTPVPETATAIMVGIGTTTVGLLIHRTRGR